IVLFFLSEQVIIGMYGIDFYGSITTLKILLPGVVLLTVFKVMNMDLAGKGKPWISMKAMIPALFTNIILNLLLIPDYGADGASIASTISYSISAILFTIFYCKEVKISYVELFSYNISDLKYFTNILKKRIN